MKDGIEISKILPVVAYKRDGSRHIVGEASVRTGPEGLISHITIDGEHALGILKSGTRAFSIGYPPNHLDIENRMDTMKSSWLRRYSRFMRRNAS